MSTPFIHSPVNGHSCTDAFISLGLMPKDGHCIIGSCQTFFQSGLYNFVLPYIMYLFTYALKVPGQHVNIPSIYSDGLYAVKF
jgi:hypothetical protein